MSNRASVQRQTEELLFAEFCRTRDQGLRDRVIESYDYLVRRVVYDKFSRASELTEDLLQVGRCGLVLAVDRFEPERGCRFSTYAIPTIEGEIKHYLRDKGHWCRVNRYIANLGAEISDRWPDWRSTLPSIEAVAKQLEVGESKVADALDYMKNCRPVLFSDVTLSEDDLPIEETLGQEDENLLAVDDNLELRREISNLSVRCRQFVDRRYFKGMTQSEVACLMGWSQMHVSRLEKRVLNCLRRILTDGRPPPCRDCGFGRSGGNGHKTPPSENN